MNKYFKIAVHIVVWSLLFILFWDELWQNEPFVKIIEKVDKIDSPWSFNSFQNIIMTGWIFLFILNFMIPAYIGYFIIPLTYRSKRKWLWIAIIIIFILLSLSGAVFDQKYFKLSTYVKPLLILGAGYGFRLIINYFDEKRKTEKMEKENLRSQLKNLKDQINPHLLFNTLHNIDGLIESEPDKASKMIMKLSDLLRYMIYQTNKDIVKLDEELILINNYIELQNIRLSNNIIEFHVDGITKNVLVPPLIFIPVVENAFKYFDKNKKEKIIIKFTANKDQVIFSCRNYYNIENVRQKENGTGLDNLKKRLELIYSKNHKFEFTDENGIFEITMVLPKYEAQNLNN